MLLEWMVPAVVVALGFWIWMIHRNLSSVRRGAIATWDPLEQRLQQRHDLVAPLAQTALAQAALAHARQAKKLTEAMIQARNATLLADLSPEATGRAEIRLAEAMQRVLALGNSHPQLSADLTFRRIQSRFERLGDEIAEARDAFNEAALGYNRAASGFPAILIARYAQLPLLEYFGLDNREREAMHAAALTRRP